MFEVKGIEGLVSVNTQASVLWHTIKKEHIIYVYYVEKPTCIQYAVAYRPLGPSRDPHNAGPKQLPVFL